MICSYARTELIQPQKTQRGTLNAYYPVEEASLESYMLYDSNYMKFRKNAKPGQAVKRSRVDRLDREGGWIGWVQDFECSENISQTIGSHRWAILRPLFILIQHATPRVNMQWRWWVHVCFWVVTAVPHCWEVVIMGKAMQIWRQNGKSLQLPLSFVMNIKFL